MPEMQATKLSKSQGASMFKAMSMALKPTEKLLQRQKILLTHLTRNSYKSAEDKLESGKAEKLRAKEEEKQTGFLYQLVTKTKVMQDVGRNTMKWLGDKWKFLLAAGLFALPKSFWEKLYSVIENTVLEIPDVLSSIQDGTFKDKYGKKIGEAIGDTLGVAFGAYLAGSAFKNIVAPAIGGILVEALKFKLLKNALTKTFADSLPKNTSLTNTGTKTKRPIGFVGDPTSMGSKTKELQKASKASRLMPILGTAGRILGWTYVAYAAGTAIKQSFFDDEAAGKSFGDKIKKALGLFTQTFTADIIKASTVEKFISDVGDGFLKMSGAVTKGILFLIKNKPKDILGPPIDKLSKEDIVSGKGRDEERESLLSQASILQSQKIQTPEDRKKLKAINKELGRLAGDEAAQLPEVPESGKLGSAKGTTGSKPVQKKFGTGTKEWRSWKLTDPEEQARLRAQYEKAEFLNKKGGDNNLTSGDKAKLKEALGKRESGGNYRSINTLGFSGKYQFGDMALEDMGLLKKGASKLGSVAKVTSNPNNWTIKGGLSAWLSDSGLQEKTMDRFMAQNLRELQSTPGFKNFDKFNVAGSLAAAHLVGAGGAKKFLSGIDSADDYGTKASTYFQLGKNAIAAAKGFSGVVKQPTVFLTGEKGPEMVNITPIIEPTDKMATFNNLQNQNLDAQRMGGNGSVVVVDKSTHSSTKADHTMTLTAEPGAGDAKQSLTSKRQ